MTYRRPYWTPARSVARILLRLGTLLLWVTLLTADIWVAASGGSTTTRVPSSSIVEGVNISCRIALIVASIGSASGIVREILLIGSRRRATRPVIKVPQSDSMDLLERYLQAVRLFVPRRQHDDIVAEVSTNLVTRMEDLKKELGRPLSDEERVDVVRRNGHPVVVAGQYRGHERLIGPTLFPVYLNTLIAGLGITLLLSLMLGLFTPRATAGQRPGFLDPRCVPSTWSHGVCVHDPRVRSRRTLAVASTIGCARLTRARGSAGHSACTAASRPARIHRVRTGGPLATGVGFRRRLLRRHTIERYTLPC